MGVVVFGRSYSEASSFHGASSCEPRQSFVRPGFCLSPSPFFQHWLSFGTSPSLATCPERCWHTLVLWHGAGAGNQHAPCPMERWREWPLGMAAGKAPCTGNEEGVGSMEEQCTALNMKGKEHFCDHQGHFSKRVTSACSGLKQVNARRQPDQSLLQ